MGRQKETLGLLALGLLLEMIKEIYLHFVQIEFVTAQTIKHNAWPH